MTGQIPKYGACFRLERAPEYSTTLNSSVYVLKQDPRWVIRSDKTSKRWGIYFLSDDWTIPIFMNEQPSLGKAMAKLLDGIDKGFYLVREGA